MIIRNIKLHNFRNFVGTHEFDFNKLNLITGNIGCGKSTLSRIAITFALYGDSEVSLATLPSRGKSKNCWVELTLKDGNKQYVIKREYPSKLSVKENDIEILEEALATEKDKWIAKRFGDLNYFRKFKMIDLRQGINLLEEGKTSLRKTLVSLNENLLNNIRQRLLNTRSLYERYNRETNAIVKHYPSLKRLEVLNKYKNIILEDKTHIDTHIKSIRKDLNNLFSEKSKVESDLVYNKNLSKSVDAKLCPTCKQFINNQISLELKSQALNDIKQIEADLNAIYLEIKLNQNAIEKEEQNIQEIYSLLESINYFINKLEIRLNQTDYKYSNKDVLLVNDAIKELDKFYSYFILESVKSLEPIINTVISKIGFSIKFQLDTKHDFDIILVKDSQEFSYKDLSSGQRLTLTVAFQLALLLERGDTGFIVCDEGWSNLDIESINSLYELFEELPFQIISVIHRFTTKNNAINLINLGDYFNAGYFSRENEKSIQEKRATDGTTKNRSNKISKTKIRTRKTGRVEKSLALFDEQKSKQSRSEAF